MLWSLMMGRISDRYCDTVDGVAIVMNQARDPSPRRSELSTLVTDFVKQILERAVRREPAPPPPPRCARSPARPRRDRLRRRARAQATPPRAPRSPPRARGGRPRTAAWRAGADARAPARARP